MDLVVLAQSSNTTSITDPRVVVPALVTLFVLLLSNSVILWRIRLDARSTLKREATLQEVARLKEQLERFYDPLLALNCLNAAMFNSLGRGSFPDDPHLKADAEVVWKKVVDDVILPTNRKMCDLIKQYSHLLDPSDDFERYMAFVVHAESYELFTRKRNEIHRNFLYPKDFEEGLVRARDAIIVKLEAASRDIGSYLLNRRD